MAQMLDSVFKCCEGTAKAKGRVASWVATTNFSLLMFSISSSRPLLHQAQPHSLVAAMVSLISFIVFVSAASVMIRVGGCFTRMQVSLLFVSAMATLLT